MRPPIITNESMLVDRMRMLQALGDMEVAAKLLIEKSSPDELYAKLKSELVPVERSSSEFKDIVLAVKNTHAPTHSTFELEVESLFRLSRVGEENFKTNIGNQQLLWYGARLTSWFSILSQGLKLPPTEAPTTGFMFGKGIYFADSVSKSANYCFSTPTANLGILLLSQVACGQQCELTQAEETLQLKPGLNSAKGVGRSAPDPAGNIKLPQGSDCTFHTGKLVAQANVQNTNLLYNEFVVYDLSQVLMRYILIVKFNPIVKSLT